MYHSRSNLVSEGDEVDGLQVSEVGVRVKLVVGGILSPRARQVGVQRLVLLHLLA